MSHFPAVILNALSCIGLLAALAPASSAQSYPVRPIRIEAGFPAGSTIDILARVVAQKLNEAWKQPVIVDNKAGAGGNIAAETVAKAAPDGYTLLLGNNALIISALSSQKLSYSAQSDLLPLVYVASAPHGLVVTPTLPVNSVRQLITLARAQPGQLNFASSGIGTPPHLAGELFKSVAHVNIVHVPYKGSTQGLTDVATGEIALYFSGLPPALPLLQAHKLKALAVTGKRRSEAVANVPTMAESGVANCEVGFWYGVFAPAKLPREVSAKLNDEIDRALRTPDVRDHFASLGLDAVGGSMSDFERFFKAEVEKWTMVVKTNRLALE